MRRAWPKRPAKRAVRNQLAVMQAMHDNTTPVIEQTGVRRGPQPEGETNKEVAAWRNTKPNLLLERNKRRLAVPMGYDKPILLGWLAEGSPDWIGYESVTITPNMIGRKVAVFVGLEAKRPVGGVVSKEQQAFLDNARDAGAMVGVVRSWENCDEARARWMARIQADER